VDILRQVDRVPLIEKRLNVSAEGRDTGECSGIGIHQIAATVIQLVPGIVDRGFKDGELLLLFVVHVDVVEGSATASCAATACRCASMAAKIGSTPAAVATVVGIAAATAPPAATERKRRRFVSIGVFVGWRAMHAISLSHVE
jgi:hypothetical protein